MILRMAAPHKPEILNSHKYMALIEILKTFLNTTKPDLIIVKEISMILEKMEKLITLSNFNQKLFFIMKPSRIRTTAHSGG